MKESIFVKAADSAYKKTSSAIEKEENSFLVADVSNDVRHHFHYAL